MATEIILGIDPGFGRIGYGIIARDDSRQRGSKSSNDWQAVDYGCITTSMKDPFVARLSELYQAIMRLIKKHKPTRLAVEDLFFFKNLKTAIKVGQARGVILLTAVQNKIPVDEYTPLQVKQAITGYGRAEKAQMQRMIQTILGLKHKIKSDDAADALAVALCAAQCLWTKKYV